METATGALTCLHVKVGWREQALCSDLEDEPRTWFFGDADNAPTKDQHERAAMFCQLCPAQADCLHDARTNDDGFGVWGGLSPSQRKRYFNGPPESLERVLARAENRLDLYLAERGLGRDAVLEEVLEILSEPLGESVEGSSRGLACVPEMGEDVAGVPEPEVDMAPERVFVEVGDVIPVSA